MLVDNAGYPDIIGIKSGEGEEIEYGKAIKVKSNGQNGVEVWMGTIEEYMKSNIQRRIKLAH
jgi:hypothetical protein